MHYADLKAKAKKKDITEMTEPENTQKLPPSPTTPPQNPSIDQKKHCDEIEELVVEKYKGIKKFYDDINNPNNIVPNRDQLKESLNNLLLAEEKVKFNEMSIIYEARIEKYIQTIESLIKIIETLLRINE